jgi:hypothetical protein
MAQEKTIEQPQIEKIAPVSVENKSTTAETLAERALPSWRQTPDKVTFSEKSHPNGDGGIASASVMPSFQKRRELAIDNILAEGLSEVFLKMKPAEQQKFKKQGEETAAKINLLLSQTKIKVNKIIELIKRWLSIIPGINKFFLEQEAKIKTDKIIKIKDKF